MAAHADIQSIAQQGGLTLADMARMIRDALKDKTYLELPLGDDIAAYLRAKRKRLTEPSFRDYEGSLDKFARFFLDVELEGFEPPAGTRRVEEFLDHQYGQLAPRTYNKNLSILRDFFKFQAVRGEMHGDPTLAIERARARGVYRTTFNADQIRAIIASQDEIRDRLAVRLLLDYGLRKGALAAIQFKHFDHFQRRLTVFTKGEKVRTLPIPSKVFWNDLERLILDVQAKPADFLMWRSKTIPYGKPDVHGHRLVRSHRFPEKPMTAHGLHKWWYRCLARAGVVAEGTSSGERMHKARHTAGQRVLDATGNLKAVQKLLGHASIQTTGDVYADWDVDQLAATLRDVLEEDV
jgi:integrase/recombinase XerC